MELRTSTFLLFVFAVVLLVQGKPLTVLDINLVPRVSNPVVTPLAGDTSYVFSATVWDNVANKKTSNLYLSKYGSDIGTVRLAPQNYVSDFNPAWSQDGNTVFFLSNRGGETNIWAIDLEFDINTAYQVSFFPISIETFKMSPKGNNIALSTRVFAGMTMEETAKKKQEIAASRVNAQKYDIPGEFVNRWDEFWPTPVEYVHVFYIKLSKNPSTGRWKASPANEALDVMGTMAGDCPSRPFGDSGEYDISYDEQSVAFTTQIGSDKRWSTDLNVYEYNVPSGKLTCLSCSNKATDTTPAYSPDGRYIAYLSMEIPKYESDTKKIKLYERATGAVRYVAKNFDRSIDALMWDQSSYTTLYAQTLDIARQVLFKVEIDNDAVSLFAGDSVSSGWNFVSCPDRPSKTCTLFAKNKLNSPTEIFLQLNSGQMVQKTNMTASVLSSVEFTEYSEMWFTGANGDRVHSWIHKPYGFNPNKKYPVVLYIHGGPEGPWEDGWSYRWNPQVIAAQGYVVLAPNFHGTSSFGSNFTKSILLDWGGKPFQDLMIALDTAAAKYPWIDINRAGAMGASYGGFMINWVNSQTTRFKCLICHDGVFNPAEHFYTTDELYFPETEFGGLPWDKNAVYDKWNPSRYVEQMVTPELIFHGGIDYRISDVVGLSAYTALQRRGIPSKFIRFPKENHWVLNPNNSIYWHQNVFEWLAQWLA